jgi:hypothetical protein
VCGGEGGRDTGMEPKAFLSSSLIQTLVIPQGSALTVCLAPPVLSATPPLTTTPGPRYQAIGPSPGLFCPPKLACEFWGTTEPSPNDSEFLAQAGCREAVHCTLA